MTYSDALNALGLTQAMAESLIYMAAIAIGVGMVLLMLWQYIAVGIGVFVLFSVFSHHEPSESTTTIDAPSKTEFVKTPSPSNEYMEECEALTERNDICLEIVIDRIADGSATLLAESFKDHNEFKQASRGTLIDTDNQEYKSRRATALGLPNAVVWQKTIP
jgi:hypothetical protein